MTNPDNLTDTTLPDAAHVDAADGAAAVADTLSLAELNQTLGKDFKDRATALKALKDTFSYVGKKTETPQQTAPVDASLKDQVRSLQEEVFYANNPEYKGVRDLIRTMGGNPSEVVGSDAFKAVYEKVKVADEVAKKQSVVSSNARVGQSSSRVDNAVKAANGNRTDVMMEELSSAIREEYGF